MEIGIVGLPNVGKSTLFNALLKKLCKVSKRNSRMNDRHKLTSYPKNKDKFIRLVEFFGEVLEVCKYLNIEPIMDGSMAVFAYTQNSDIEVNDVDTSISESGFPKVISELEKRGISYILKDYGVIQVLKDDLKVELGSAERYLKGVSQDYKTLEIADFKVKTLSPSALRDLYKQSMDDRLKTGKESDLEKYRRLKTRIDLLNVVLKLTGD